jgi:integrase
LRQVHGGLARREREALAKVFPYQESRQGLPNQDAAGSSESQKPTPYETAHAIAATWAEANEHSITLRKAARCLADELQGMKGRIPPTLIEAIVARWRKTHSHNFARSLSFCLRKILRSIDSQLGTHLALAVPKPPPPHPRRVTIQPDDLDRMLSKAEPWMKLFVSLMVGMGLRWTEAKSAGPANYDRQTQTLCVRTKGGRVRDFPVPDGIAALIALAPDTNFPTFLEQVRGKHMCDATLRGHWYRLKRDAGIPHEITPHDLRRTAAVRVYRSTGDIFAAKTMLGHESLTSTAVYLAAHESEALRVLRDHLIRWTPKGEKPQ